jgi:transposase
MRPITFSEADLAALAEERYHHPDPRVQRKMEVLWLKHHGETHERIAVLASVSRSSVQRYLDDYLQGGLDEIRRCRAKGSTSQLDAHAASLEEHFRQCPPRSVKEARQLIKERTGIQRGLTQVRRFLRRIGMAPRKVTAIAVPPKSSVEEHAKEQARFLEDELGPRLEDARAGRRQLLFVDASHFVYATLLGGVRAADHAGTGQRALPEVRGGDGAGCAIGDRAAVPAGVQPEPEPDRAGVEVRQEGVSAVGLPPRLRGVHRRHQPVPGRPAQQAQGRCRQSPLSQLPDL